jgi:HSP20 family protein
MASTPVEVKKTTPAAGYEPWRSFRAEMDRLFDRFSGGFGLPSIRRMFEVEPTWRDDSAFNFAAPAVDVTEDGKTYKITAELPGLDEKNIEVMVTGDMLTLKGEKHYEKEEKDKNRHVSERAYGSFQRSFVLPGDIDRNKITADLTKGVLTVVLPKTAAAQQPAKKIEVKAAA